jgi:hypothetical protein
VTFSGRRRDVLEPVAICNRSSKPMRPEAASD